MDNEMAQELLLIAQEQTETLTSSLVDGYLTAKEEIEKYTDDPEMVDWILLTLIKIMIESLQAGERTLLACAQLHGVTNITSEPDEDDE